MIFNADFSIRQNFLLNKWNAERARQREAENWLNFYNDDNEALIKEKLKELFHPQNYDRLYYHVNQSQNILKRVVKETSMIYKGKPSRTLTVDSPRYEAIKKEVKIDQALKDVNRLVNVINDIIIKVGVREGKMVYDIITPDSCIVLQNEDDPTEAEAIIYGVTLKNDPFSDKLNYHYWNKWGDHYLLDGSFRIIKAIYDSEGKDVDGKDVAKPPYVDKKAKRYTWPFVFCRRKRPQDAFWNQDTGRDLYNAAVLTSVKMTLFDYYFKTASFKQPYIVGDMINVPNNQILDPLTVFRASGENATVGLLDMQINLDQLKNALIFQINSVINNYGISADQWTLSISEMSGVALKIRNRALLEIREEQLPVYRDIENDLFNVTRIVNNAHFKEKIPENAEFSIDFGEITFPEDPKEKLKYQTSLLRAGLISQGEFYQAFRPDVDEEEGKKRFIQNVREFEKTKSGNPGLDNYLNRIFGVEEEENEDEEI